MPHSREMSAEWQIVFLFFSFLSLSLSSLPVPMKRLRHSMSLDHCHSLLMTVINCVYAGKNNKLRKTRLSYDEIYLSLTSLRKDSKWFETFLCCCLSHPSHLFVSKVILLITWHVSWSRCVLCKNFLSLPMHTRERSERIRRDYNCSI